MKCECVLLVLAAATLHVAAVMPPFSFDTIPLAFHSSNSSSAGWSTSQLRSLASRYFMVTLEKYHELERFVPAKTLAAPYTSKDGL